MSTGITPSGHIHIGNMREVLTADTVVKSLRELGADVKFYYIADTFDPLRKVYPFLDPKVYEQHIGKPLSEIPAPGDPKAKSYAEHFLQPFLDSLEQLDIHVEVLRADRMYKEGRYVPQIIKALEAKDEIRKILKDETGKATEDDWSPFTPICTQTGKMSGNKVVGFDAKNQTVQYVSETGFEGEVKMSGGGKLTWRVDWPARWQILGITFEPFGKDHASKGGSYDTAIRFAREIFGFEPPHPAVYEWISLKGGGDMSSSKGNVISVAEMIDVVPPDVLKYSVMKIQPNKTIVFDPGLPLLNLIDEFDDETSKQRNARAVELSKISKLPPIGVPFKHIVFLTQLEEGNVDKISEKIIFGGYNKPDHESLKRRVEYAKQWLEKFGTEDMKFKFQEEIPSEVQNLSKPQRNALKSLGEHLSLNMQPTLIQNLIYTFKDNFQLEPKQIFEAIYISLSGKKSGPKVGLYLSTLDQDKLKKVQDRFIQVGSL